jgi:hypothetical protein
VRVPRFDSEPAVGVDHFLPLIGHRAAEQGDDGLILSGRVERRLKKRRRHERSAAERLGVGLRQLHEFGMCARAASFKKPTPPELDHVPHVVVKEK